MPEHKNTAIKRFKNKPSTQQKPSSPTSHHSVCWLAHLPLRALAECSCITNMGLIISVGFDSCNFSERSTKEL